MLAVYPILAGEIAKRGIKKTVIAEQLGITSRSLHNKLTGVASFSWEEACKINDCFFPDMDPKTLFQKADSRLDDKGA